MSFDYIKQYYGVSAKRGDRIEFGGRQGVITSATHYIHVRFDGTKHSVPIHPTEDGLRYLKEGDGTHPNQMGPWT